MPTRKTPLPDWVLDHRRVLGRKISHLRRSAGVSQDQLAALVGVDRRSIQRYENGTRDPHYSDLLLIAHVFGVSVRDLV